MRQSSTKVHKLIGQSICHCTNWWYRRLMMMMMKRKKYEKQKTNFNKSTGKKWWRKKAIFTLYSFGIIALEPAIRRYCIDLSPHFDSLICSASIRRSNVNSRAGPLFAKVGVDETLRSPSLWCDGKKREKQTKIIQVLIFNILQSSPLPSVTFHLVVAPLERPPASCHNLSISGNDNIDNGSSASYQSRNSGPLDTRRTGLFSLCA